MDGWKRRLLHPTGTVECDLISFMASRQQTATSPALPSSQDHTVTRPYVEKADVVQRRKPTRPRTECSARRPRCADHGVSRTGSAHVLRTVNNSLSPYGNKGGSNLKRELERTRILLKIDQGCTRRNVAKSSDKEFAYQMNDSPNKGNDDGAVNTPTPFPTQSHKPVAVYRKSRKKVKKPKKRTNKRTSVLPLPTGSAFDNLVRSGAIARHIAKKERRGMRG